MLQFSVCHPCSNEWWDVWCECSCQAWLCPLVRGRETNFELMGSVREEGGGNVTLRLWEDTWLLEYSGWKLIVLCRHLPRSTATRFSASLLNPEQCLRSLIALMLPSIFWANLITTVSQQSVAPSQRPSVLQFSGIHSTITPISTSACSFLKLACSIFFFVFINWACFAALMATQDSVMCFLAFTPTVLQQATCGNKIFSESTLTVTLKGNLSFTCLHAFQVTLYFGVKVMWRYPVMVSHLLIPSYCQSSYPVFYMYLWLVNIKTHPMLNTSWMLAKTKWLLFLFHKSLWSKIYIDCNMYLTKTCYLCVDSKICGK